MKTFLLALALHVIAAFPVEAAVTKPYADGEAPQLSPSASLPPGATIYLGTGVLDGGAQNAGVATAISCTNGSGVAATVRFVVLSFNGVPAGSATISIPHGRTWIAATHNTTAYIEDTILLSVGGVPGVGLIVESTETAVFCSASVIDASTSVPIGTPLRLFRLNQHPGVVE